MTTTISNSLMPGTQCVVLQQRKQQQNEYNLSDRKCILVSYVILKCKAKLVILILR